MRFSWDLIEPVVPVPQYRGVGYGRALGRAAMQWGGTNTAPPTSCFTEVGGASGRLCAAEGLRSLGFVNRKAM